MWILRVTASWVKKNEDVFQLDYAPRNRSLTIYISKPHSSNGEGVVKYAVSRQAI